MGGVALLCAFLPGAAILSYLAAPSYLLPSIHVWLAVVGAMALLGIADDRHSLSPRARLLISFVVFGLVAIFDPKFNVRVLLFEHPDFLIGLGHLFIAIFFTALCCVGLVNAVNMADGKNGLVIGLCLGWLGILATRAPMPLLPFIGLLSVVLAVLLFFNLRGELFLGDGGAYGFAGAIALIAIAIYNSPGNHATSAIAADELILLFLVPVADSFRLTFKRWRRGQSPMAADKDHLHHILLDKWGWPLGLFVYWTTALLVPFTIIVIIGI
jgi:UDP-GlcNAc:undecaprenyl-phosphate/decaprenyl-phosphate GlcNAc-1-phosphate transferase